MLLQSDREQLMQQLRQLQAEVEAQQQELQQYADSDPELLAHLSQAAQVTVAGGRAERMG